MTCAAIYRNLIPLSFCAAMTLTSCTNTASRTETDRFFQDSLQAENYLEQGLPKQAASVYQSLALANPTNQSQYQLLAVQALIQSSDLDAAKIQLDTINSAILTDTELQLLNLSYAQVYLGQGMAEQALNRLKQVDVKRLQTSHQIVYYQSLAFAYTLVDQTEKSVETRLLLSKKLIDPKKRLENNQVILNTLNRLSAEELNSLDILNNTELEGWVSLARLLKSHRLNQLDVSLANSLDEWKQLYPQHPASYDFLQFFLKNDVQNISLPNSIAVLLPQSGRFALAAEVITKGVQAAYAVSNYQPIIRYYDSAMSEPSDLYQQAIAEGAELIIGPLSKARIQSLAANAELTVPVLALNHIENLTQHNLFQFGLSPIDNIVQLLERARNDGHQNVLLLTPDNRNGERMANYFQDFWPLLNGEVLEAQSYDAKSNDFSEPIKQLLDLDQSQERYRRLKPLFSEELNYVERRRQDVDAIFIAAKSKVARSLYPQLRFFRANKIPIYATTEIYSGQANSALDRDLNSIIFCDIPWYFESLYSGDLSFSALAFEVQNTPIKYRRLMALGIDAFNLVPYMNQLGTETYKGATGELSVNFENKISRKLACAQFVEGTPQLLDVWLDGNES